MLGLQIVRVSIVQGSSRMVQVREEHFSALSKGMEYKRAHTHMSLISSTEKVYDNY